MYIEERWQKLWNSLSFVPESVLAPLFCILGRPCNFAGPEGFLKVVLTDFRTAHGTVGAEVCGSSQGTGAVKLEIAMQLLCETANCCAGQAHPPPRHELIHVSANHCNVARTVVQRGQYVGIASEMSLPNSPTIPSSAFGDIRACETLADEVFGGGGVRPHRFYQ
jgi:hypothetical protein